MKRSGGPIRALLDQGPFRSDISEEDGVCPGSGRSSHPEFEGVEDLPGTDLLASPAGGARAAVGLYATLGDVPIPDDRQSLLETFPHASPAPYASRDDAGQDGSGADYPHLAGLGVGQDLCHQVPAVVRWTENNI